MYSVLWAKYQWWWYSGPLGMHDFGSKCGINVVTLAIFFLNFFVHIFEFCNSKLKLTEFNYPFNYFFYSLIVRNLAAKTNYDSILQLWGKIEVSLKFGQNVQIWQLKQVMILFCSCRVKLQFPSNLVKMLLLLMCIGSNLLKWALAGFIWGWGLIAKIKW